MTNEIWLLIVLITGIVCLFLGAIVWYNTGEPKCQHQWKEIINDKEVTKHTVVHMCMKCGRRKVAKVK